MMRALGFLSGIGLTVAAFLLVLDNRDNRPANTVAGLAGDATPEQLSEVFEAIAEQVDVVPPAHAPDPGVASEPDSALTERETQNGLQVTPPDPQQRSDGQLLTPESELASAQGDATGGFELLAANPTQRPDVQTGPEQALTPDTEFATSEAGPQDGFAAAGLDPDQRRDLQAQAQADTAGLADSGDPGIHLFWSPFRSEWSARGFAQRLSSATRVPVEVVNAGPGKYRVAFSYQDETERLARIERIETVTGLNLE